MTRLTPAVLLLLSCQTYQFEPVYPAAVSVQHDTFKVSGIAPRPNLFLLVDKSGSMNFAADGAAPTCAGCADSDNCPQTCATRWQELKSAMSSFLTTSGSSLHLGMVPYPAGARPNQNETACTPTTLDDVLSYGVPLNQADDADEASMLQSAQAISKGLDDVGRPVGGTPTSAGLEALTDYEPLLPKNGRQSYVLLLTDGVPNCNPKLSPSTCTCTTSGSACVALQCLDDDATVLQAATLKSQNIATIVVGFGKETGSAVGRQTLERLATAGGFVRTCQSDADCAGGTGDTCSTSAVDACGRTVQACSQKYFQATDASQLGVALTRIRESVNCAPVCTLFLSETPDDEKSISVRVGGAVVPPGADSWRYMAPIEGDRAAIRFAEDGPWCQRFKATPGDRPLDVEISIAKQL